MGFSLDDEETSTSSATPTTPDAAAHAQEIINASPDVQEHAIKAVTDSAQQADAAVELDKNGVKFDATKHTGTKLKDGSWRKKKGSVLGSTPAEKKPLAGATPMLTPEQEGMSRAAGAAAINLVFGTMTQLFGDEWQPRTKAVAGYDERELMQTAAGDYCVAKGITDFPPGVTLSILGFGYFIARFQMPVTKQKLSGFKAFVAIRWMKYKTKKEFKKAGILARVEIVDGVLMVDGKPRDQR